MWNIDVDLLYWQAQESGLAFVATESKAINPSFDWNPGFRIGISYGFCHEDWAVSLIFTHFHTHAWGNETRSLTPLLANPDFFEEDSDVNKATMRWRLHFGQFDLLLERNLKASSDLSFNPFLGVRVGCLRQKNRVQYFGGTLFPNSEDLISSKNKFLGTGLVLGTNVLWKWKKYWGLYAEGAFSLLYGEFYVHQAEYSEYGIAKRFGFHQTFFATSPVLDLVLGLKFDKEWWEIHLGWEEHLYFSQNQWIHLKGYLANQGDLSLAGAVLGASIHF